MANMQWVWGKDHLADVRLVIRPTEDAIQQRAGADGASQIVMHVHSIVLGSESTVLQSKFMDPESWMRQLSSDSGCKMICWEVDLCMEPDVPLSVGHEFIYYMYHKAFEGMEIEENPWRLLQVRCLVFVSPQHVA